MSALLRKANETLINGEEGAGTDILFVSTEVLSPQEGVLLWMNSQHESSLAVNLDIYLC